MHSTPLISKVCYAYIYKNILSGYGSAKGGFSDNEKYCSFKDSPSIDFNSPLKSSKNKPLLSIWSNGFISFHIKLKLLLYGTQLLHMLLSVQVLLHTFHVIPILLTYEQSYSKNYSVQILK